MIRQAAARQQGQRRRLLAGAPLCWLALPQLAGPGQSGPRRFTAGSCRLSCSKVQWAGSKLPRGSRLSLRASGSRSSTASPCGRVVSAGETLVVRDAGDDPRFAAQALVVGEPHIRFFAGAPLLDSEGEVLGALWVADPAPRERADSPIRGSRAAS